MPKFGNTWVTDSILATRMVSDYWKWRSGGEQPEPLYWSNSSNTPQTNITVNISDLQLDQQAQVKQVLAVWQDVANVRFSITTGSAQIRYIDDGVKAETGSTTFYDVLTGRRTLTQSTVDIPRDWAEGPGHGNFNYFFQSIVHETGHALGLGHTGNYAADKEDEVVDWYNTDGTVYANDTWQMSVMSYNEQSDWVGSGSTTDWVITPQMADINAIQRLYGAATTRTGDSVYGFNSNVGSFYDFDTYTSLSRPNNAPAFTLYDSGGVDTIDCSGFTLGQKIDLNPGSFSSIGSQKNNVGIWTKSIIENAEGGSSRDIILGNDVGNVITGHRGSDLMTGRGGADTFVFFKYDTSSTRSTADTIFDFDTIGGDRIDFSHRDADSNTAGDQAFTFIGASAFHKVPGELHYITEASDTYIEGDTNGNGRADFIIRLEDAMSLTSSSFVL